jgi:hypothetical protein
MSLQQFKARLVMSVVAVVGIKRSASMMSAIAQLRADYLLDPLGDVGVTAVARASGSQCSTPAS